MKFKHLKPKFLIKKDFLYEKYVKDKMSATSIAALVGCTASTIYVKMIEFNIPPRNGPNKKRRSKTEYCELPKHLKSQPSVKKYD